MVEHENGKVYLILSGFGYEQICIADRVCDFNIHRLRFTKYIRIDIDRNLGDLLGFPD